MLGHKLRHRVRIESPAVAQDSVTGAVATNWTAIHINVPANIAPLSGREFLSANSVQAGVSARITIRCVAGILPAMRVVHGADVYAIKSVLPDDASGNRHLTLMTERGVNAG